MSPTCDDIRAYAHSAWCWQKAMAWCISHTCLLLPQEDVDAAASVVARRSPGRSSAAPLSNCASSISQKAGRTARIGKAGEELADGPAVRRRPRLPMLYPVKELAQCQSRIFTIVLGCDASQASSGLRTICCAVCWGVEPCAASERALHSCGDVPDAVSRQCTQLHCCRSLHDWRAASKPALQMITFVGGASQDEEDGPAVQGPMLPGEMAKMSKLFDDPDKLNLVSCTKSYRITRVTLVVPTCHMCIRCLVGL